MTSMDLDGWTRVKDRLRAEVGDDVYASWFARMELDGSEGDTVIRTLPPRMKPVETPAPHRDMREVKSNGGDLRNGAGPISAVHEALGGSPLDPRLTFETFVVGRSNTLAHAAAKQVAQARRGDMVMFNPLYVHAGVGLGKTHLLQSLAWAGNATAERKVLYLTAEKFMYGFVAALRAQ